MANQARGKGIMRAPTPVADRIWQAIRVTDSGCWEWGLSRVYGYGQLWVGSRTDGTRRRMFAHVASWETFEGPIPDGFEIDHLCRNRACCNPEHLEPVTHRENMLRSSAPCATQARQTHCKRGHPFDEENTYRNKGKRYCRTCLKAAKEGSL